MSSFWSPSIDTSTKPHLLWISDGPDYPSGFATVARNVTFRLADIGYPIHFIHCQKGGLVMPFAGAQFQDLYDVCPNARVWMLPGTGELPFGEATFEFIYDVLRRNRQTPDAVVSQLDLHMAGYLRNYHKKHGFRWVHYLPLDGVPVPLNWEPMLREIDDVVCMSKFGQEQLRDTFGVEVPYIYHGVNTDIFAPQPVKRFEGWEDKFVIGCVNRNQHRKRIPELLEAYKIFRKGKENKVFLYLHMAEDDRMGWKLPELTRQMGIQGGVGWAPGFDPNVGEDLSRLVNIYNNLDVFLSTTGGEGFGLTTIEAMACEIPVVITDYTTSDEIVGFSEKNPAGLPIRVKQMYRPSDLISSVNRALVDPEHAAEQLQRLYDDVELRRELGKNGRARCQKLFHWDVIAKKWDKLLTHTL